ncbi:unnamed protein product, partial [Tetraodon nigroviridis]
HKGRNNQCEKETNTCLYSLSMKNLDISQTGTYYCAVAACGRILFGGGATLECEESTRGRQAPLCSCEGQTAQHITEAEEQSARVCVLQRKAIDFCFLFVFVPAHHKDC